MIRPALAIALAVGICAPANAHDFWLQPRRFHHDLKAVAPLSIQIGHAEDREAWSKDPARIVLLRSIGPSGAPVDHRHRLQSGSGDTAIPLEGAGVHMVALQTNHAQSHLPAVRFNAYLQEEGLTGALEHRRRTAASNRPGREIYSRRAKTLVRLGPPGGAPQPHVSRPVGLTLEIVPEVNPYAVRPGGTVPVRVYYDGAPLAGALVKLTDLASDAKPLDQRRTDRSGRAAFRIPRRGEWLLNVVWTRPLANDPRADFDTTFSSLTFAIG